MSNKFRLLSPKIIYFVISLIFFDIANSSFVNATTDNNAPGTFQSTQSQPYNAEHNIKQSGVSFLIDFVKY